MTAGLDDLRNAGYPKLAAVIEEMAMTAGGVIPHHGQFRETGSFVTRAGDVVTFGHEGTRVVILTDGSIALTPAEQDTFARLLFRAIGATEVIDDEEIHEQPPPANGQRGVARQAPGPGGLPQTHPA